MKPQQQPQPPPPPPEEEEPYGEINNYYHIENYRGNSRGHRPYRGQQGGKRPFRGSQQRGRDNKTIIGANARVTADNLTPPMEAITTTIITVLLRQRWPWPWW